MDRYAQMHELEDLGLRYPPVDRTDDLVGAQQEKAETPDTGSLATKGVEGLITHKEQGSI
jgi:hypothetical protein